MINTKNISAIIFDMDGVIVDSEKIHFQSEVETCRKFAIMAPAEVWPEYVGCKARHFFSSLQARFGTIEIDIEDLINHNIKLYLELAEEKVELINGVKEFLEYVRKHFEKIGLATSGNKLSQEMVFRKFSLDLFFDFVITGRDIENGKPHPEPYQKAADGLRVYPEKCLVVEDAINGIISAKSAGCLAVGLTSSFPEKELLDAGADCVVETYEELGKILNS
jgi:beta-phosphoglucomutase